MILRREQFNFIKKLIYLFFFFNMGTYQRYLCCNNRKKPEEVQVTTEQLLQKIDSVRLELYHKFNEIGVSLI